MSSCNRSGGGRGSGSSHRNMGCASIGGSPSMYFISGNRSCSRADRRGGSSSRSDSAMIKAMATWAGISGSK